MDDLRDKYIALIADASDESTLEDLRVQAVGKKGEISLQMRQLGKMSAEERQIAGPKLNALKDEINSALAAKKTALADAALDERLRGEWLDVTLPGRQRPAGSIHPISQVTEEVITILADLGFSVAEGPQIESDWYNFDALNIPGHHPARAEMDTFYTHREQGDNRPPHVLRTHTSPVQIRSMEANGAPIRIICPGRVYRADYDQTHTPMFNQVEGLAIDVFTQMREFGQSMNDPVLEYCEDYMLADEVTPTPQIGQAVRFTGAAGGIVVTASHNPPQYNGYKVYADNGAQIIPPWDSEISDAIDASPGASETPRGRPL